MKITEIHIHPVTQHKGLVAFANLVLEGQLFLGSIAVHEKLDGTLATESPTPPRARATCFIPSTSNSVNHWNRRLLMK